MLFKLEFSISKEREYAYLIWSLYSSFFNNNLPKKALKTTNNAIKKLTIHTKTLLLTFITANIICKIFPYIYFYVVYFYII